MYSGGDFSHEAVKRVLDALLQRQESILSISCLEDVNRSLVVYSREVLVVVVQIRWGTGVRSKPPAEFEYLIPIIWLGEREESFILDARVGRRGDMQLGGVGGMDIVFYRIHFR